MSRPRLMLSEDQARQLVAQVEPIIQRHAGDTRRHRPFVHDFLRAVYHATGTTYSAAFYRKLLAAYAPGRTPSTATIELEKNLLVQDLRVRPMMASGDGTLPAGAQDGAGVTSSPVLPGTPLALQEIIGLQHHLIARLNQVTAAVGETTAATGLQAHNDYLTERLEASEAALDALRARAAHHAAQAHEQAALAEERLQQLTVMQQALDQQASAMKAIADELKDVRMFAMAAIDGVRGETRAQRERCSYLEAQLKDKELQLDTYRQRAHSPLPPPRR